MESKRFNLSRRQFIIVGSAAIATPLLMNMSDLVPKAQGSQKKVVYFIGYGCIGCHVCRMMCPQNAINFGDDKNEIDQKKCIQCGTCYSECPVSVITETNL